MSTFAPASFTFNNFTYILAYALLLALAVIRRRPPHPYSTSKTSRYLQLAIWSLSTLRFIAAYILIFADQTGSGEMFTYDGVISLFRTKSNNWVVGLWMELCTLFVVCSIWVVADAEKRGIPLSVVLALVILGFFVAGAGFVGYVFVVAVSHYQSSASAARDEDLSNPLNQHDDNDNVTATPSPPADSCLGSCTVLVTARTNLPPLIAHTFDTPGGIDFTLVHRPRNVNPSSPRPIYLWDECAIPRYMSNKILGHITIPTPPPVAGTGTFSYFEAAAGIANECGLMIAESTCSAIFQAEPLGFSEKGTALLCYQELTRIALEYCTTARQAIQLMGQLAEQYGFYGNLGSTLSGSGEAFAIVDNTEAWVMHLLPDDTGTSAIWCAQKLRQGQVSVVANMFVIRSIDLKDVNTHGSTFLMSSSVVNVATKLGLYAAASDNAVLDFTRIYSAGEARHQYYSGRRQWRALSLLAPSLQLDPCYDDALFSNHYPFSVLAEKSLTRNDFYSVLRDTYQGTLYDLSKQPASGPFGITDRFDGVPEDSGCFERPIAVYRMAYSFVGEPNGITFGSTSSTQRHHHLLHFSPHVSQTSVYLPVLVPSFLSSSSSRVDVDAFDYFVPSCLSRGSVKQIDRECAYWVFRIVKHTMKGLIWNRCLTLVERRQNQWEEEIAMRIEQASSDECVTVRQMQGVLERIGKEVLSDWWKMQDEMLLRFGDGWEHDYSEENRISRPVAYSQNWLERQHFFRSSVDVVDPCSRMSAAAAVPPKSTLWTVEEKLWRRKTRG